MSEKLVLPREWTQKSIGPLWKGAAIAGWAIALLLAQCLVIVLGWPCPGRDAPPPSDRPAPPPLDSKHRGNLEVANSMARIRCLVAVGRTQEALAETIRCLTLCERLEIEPPAELPALFAETVTSISDHRDSQAAPRPVAPTPKVRPAVATPLVEQPEASMAACSGSLPGPAYPQAARRPRLAQLPPISPGDSVLPPPPPPQPEVGLALPPLPPAGRYEFQPPAPPPMPGERPRILGY